MNLYAEAFIEAESDFRRIRAIGTPVEREFGLIWTFITRARSGVERTDVLSALRQTPRETEWPGAVLDLFLGSANADDVLGLLSTGDSREDAARACIANYFLGQEALMRDARGDAANYFRRAVETGATGYRQYWAARLELDRMGIALE